MGRVKQGDNTFAINTSHYYKTNFEYELSQHHGQKYLNIR